MNNKYVWKISLWLTVDLIDEAKRFRVETIN